MKKGITIALLVLVAAFSTQAQQLQQRDTTAAVDYDSLQLKQKDQVHIISHKLPEFPGGDRGFLTYISEHIKYPKDAVKQLIEGTVYVNFTIDTLGNVIDVRVFRSAHPLLDKAALDVIAASPKWKPAEADGVPTRIVKTVPIKFSLK